MWEPNLTIGTRGRVTEDADATVDTKETSSRQMVRLSMVDKIYGGRVRINGRRVSSPCACGKRFEPQPWNDMSTRSRMFPLCSRGLTKKQEIWDGSW